MLDEIEAAARALDTARQAYGAAMMRAFVQVENERYEATRKVAEMSHTIMLRDETIATLTRERDEARAEVKRLKRDHEEMFAELRDLSKKYDEGDAFKRGAEAMRKACARWMSKREGISQWVYDDALSALPIPEEP